MTERLKTQVGIIGAGPSGLLLGQLLDNYGIDNVILERRSADYVKGRIRAGVLETPTVEALIEAGVGNGPKDEGIAMHGVHLRWGDEGHLRVDFGLVDRHATVYGQTRVTEDLMNARKAGGSQTIYEAADVALHDFDGDGKPWLSYTHDGRECRLDCDYIAGCDGFHGVSRQSLPAEALKEFTFGFPFGWLGLLADVPPLDEEVVWVNKPRGFSMASFRSHTRSRFYIQVPRDEKVEDWDESRFFEAFREFLPPDLAEKVQEGPALDMSITQLTSYVCETMQYGNLYMCGDAVHNVPPTGAKGLNLALTDAQHLAHALRARYKDNDNKPLEQYTQRALKRVWTAVRFSWWMTNLTHRITGDPFERRVQIAELEYTKSSKAAQIAIAENFTGSGSGT